MTISMHAASVPVFKQMLGSLVSILEKAETYAEERKIDPAVLLQLRLFPDMFPLVRQVQIACDFAKGVTARLADAEVPAYDDTEQTIEQLKVRVERTIAFVDSFDASRFEGAEEREIVTRPGTPKERRFSGQDYLLTYGLPQFFFHVTTAYALLRHSGLGIGKRDYMGAY
ncbi:hypothetical protein N792_09035 [Lysobacter concretionis Ko07 = DSM 16239]|jgi:hypothetical protein|uniref:DUF1993 domain-containing protein n=1 Tax=Lysobacter concretionis Ko07 = DSM 16239 TaxID=1122185 RepID=A0A0A0ENS0_9GAMM|nr:MULTISPECIES: DUF1993 domain-containing protein [Lysobacter]KGM51783.1 hypothetical protein N792_09035 [Lysobacter concretionis Ko07 = DSM 16239]QOD92142.1 DUF1993 domain-containing protein [Lysobacter sp. CW239]